jgi:hypothetical protein
MSWGVFFVVCFAVLLTLGIARAISSAVTTTATTPPKVTFVGFEGEGNWCVATRYAAAQAVGARGVPTADVLSSTESRPKFSVFPMPVGLRWFRAEAPEYRWREHVMRPVGNFQFVDDINPCTVGILPPTKI